MRRGDLVVISYEQGGFVDVQRTADFLHGRVDTLHHDEVAIFLEKSPRSRESFLKIITPRGITGYVLSYDVSLVK